MITSWNRKRSMIFDHFGIIILFDCDSFVERKTFYDFWDSINFTVLIFAVNFRQLPKVMYKPKTHSVQVKIPSQHNLQQLPKTHCESQRGDIHVFRFLITLVSLYSFDCNYFVDVKTYYDFWSPWYHYIHSIVITSWNWNRSMNLDHFGIIIFFWLWLLRGTENVPWFLG